jgi:hypothetical protein
MELAGYLEAISRPVFEAGCGLARHLASHGSFEQTVADLKRQFRYIGDSGACRFLQVVGGPQPPANASLQP